jgi:hypothetical protein
MKEGVNVETLDLLTLTLVRDEMSADKLQAQAALPLGERAPVHAG